MKKKVLLDCRFLGPSHTGLGRYTQSLTEAINNLNPKKLDLYCLVTREQKRLASEKLTHFKPLLATARPYTLAEQREIPRLVANLKPDLTHWLHFNVPLATPTPYIVTIHDLIKHHSKGLNTTTRSLLTYPLKRLGYHLTVKKAVKQAQTIITPSNWVKKDILDHYRVDAKKIKVTPEAADPIYFKAPVSDKKLAHSYRYLLYVGNAYPHKNVIQLIKAVQKYNQDSGKTLRLVIVTGKNFFYQQLRTQVRKMGGQGVIKIKGFSSDIELRALYRQAVAFITASLFEGFGLPGLEAMAAGTPVLAAERTSLPEVYQDAASYFDPENPEEIVQAIKKVANLKNAQRKQIINKGRKHAGKFSWEETARQTIKIYENSLGL